MKRSRFKHDQTIGEKLYKLHVEQGLTFEAMAERFNMTRGTMAGLIKRYTNAQEQKKP